MEITPMKLYKNRLTETIRMDMMEKNTIPPGNIKARAPTPKPSKRKRSAAMRQMSNFGARYIPKTLCVVNPRIIKAISPVIQGRMDAEDAVPK